MANKSISLLLLFFILFSVLFNFPNLAEGREQSLSLEPVYWEGTGIIKKNTQLEKTGIKALLWIPQEKGHYLKTRKVPVDWSFFNQIELDLYSKKKTGAWINIILADHNNHLSSSYLEVDWVGWKKIELSFNQLFASFSSIEIDWKKMSYLAFESHHSALLNIDETELSIRNIQLKKISIPAQPTKTLVPYQKNNSLLFPDDEILLWRKVGDEKSNVFLIKAIEKITEGKNRFLDVKEPTLEDIRDAIFYGKLFLDKPLLSKGLTKLSTIKKQYWDTLIQENELLVQNSLISFCICLDLLVKERQENPALEKMLQSTLLYAANLEKEVVRYWINFYPFGLGNNHATRAACALGIAAIFCPLPERNEWYQLSIDTLTYFFNFQITQDGVLNEGSHYYLFLMEILTYFNHFLVTSNHQNLFVDFPFSKKLTAMVNWSIQIRNPRGYLPSIDDSWQNMVNFPARFLTPFLPNRNLLCWSSQVSDLSHILGESWNIVKPFYIPLLLLSLSSYEKPIEPTSSLCTAFDGDSQVVLRDSWKKDSSYIMITGKKISSLHEHDDTGNIQMEAFQTPILLESGYGPLGWTSINRNYYVSGQAHNVLVINGQGPKSYYNGSLGPIDSSTIQDYFSFASFSYTQMPISFNVNNKNISYNRSIAYLPPVEDYPFYTLVFDEVKAKENKNFQVLFHPNGTLETSTQQKNRYRITTPDQDNIIVDLFPLEPCKSKIQKGFYSQYWDSEKSTQYISYEQNSSSAEFATLIFPSLENSHYAVQTESNRNGSSREYRIQIANQDIVFQDYYNLNPYGEIRQMKNQGTNATMSFVRKRGTDESLECFFIQNGSFLNHKQKGIFFSTSKMNFIYFSKNQQLYKYFCQYDAKDSSSRTFFQVKDFDKLFLDNQEVEFERNPTGIYVKLPVGKHTLTFH
jgi:hypothetical protein